MLQPDRSDDRNPGENEETRYPPLELVETRVHMVATRVDLLKARVDLIEAGVDSVKPGFGFRAELAQIVLHSREAGIDLLEYVACGELFRHDRIPMNSNQSGWQGLLPATAMPTRPLETDDDK